MAQPVVVVPAAAGTDGGTDAAFAAGAATVIAAQAAETAEVAAEVATDAARTADEAAHHVFDARAAVEELRAEMVAGFETLQESMVGLLAAVTEEVEDAIDGQAPEVVEPAATDTSDSEKEKDAKPRKRGGDPWWGSR